MGGRRGGRRSPGPDRFDGADVRWVDAYAAAVAQQAAARIRSGRGRDRADIAWAAGDLITAAAEATASPVLRQAADGFRRAARAPWGRVPAVRSPTAGMIRTAAYALAACAPVAHRAVRSALTAAISHLARAIASLRRDRMLREQGRRIQEERARQPRQAAGTKAPGAGWQPSGRGRRPRRRRHRPTARPFWGADPAAAAAAAAAQSVRRSRPATRVPAARPTASR